MNYYFLINLKIPIITHAPITDTIILPIKPLPPIPIRPKRKLPTIPPTIPKMAFIIKPPLVFIIRLASQPAIAPRAIASFPIKNSFTFSFLPYINNSLNYSKKTGFMQASSYLVKYYIL